MKSTFINSPLEQFELFPVFYIGPSFSFLTNSAVFMFLTIFAVFFFLFSLRVPSSYQVIPNAYLSIVESIYDVVLDLVKKNIGDKGQIYFPFVFSIFIFILASNLTGMFPYSFTATSHISTTLSLAVIVFFGVNYIGLKTHKVEFFSLFLPSGAGLPLALMLVPIEIISYGFRVISLPVRLFANMMAGHTLLKVIVGFFWSLVSATGLLFLVSLLPLFALTILVGLELAVAAIQAFVFTILTCFYLNDAINLH